MHDGDKVRDLRGIKRDDDGFISSSTPLLAEGTKKSRSERVEVCKGCVASPVLIQRFQEISLDDGGERGDSLDDRVESLSKRDLRYISSSSADKFSFPPLDV